MTNPYEAPQATLETSRAGPPSVRDAIRSAFAILSARLIALSVALNLPLFLLETRIDTLLGENPWLAFGLTSGAMLFLATLERCIFYAAASAASAGRDPSTASLLREAVAAWPRVFAASFLAGLATLAGLVLFVFPGIYVGVRLSFADIIAFEHRATAGVACRRSAGFVTGQFWRVLALPLPLYFAAILLEASWTGIALAGSDTTGPLVLRLASSLLLSVSAASYWFFYEQQVNRGSDRGALPL